MQVLLLLLLLVSGRSFAQDFSGIQAAFAEDGYLMGHTATFQGMRGALGLSTSANNLVTGAPKKAFYLEGSGYQVGYLTGLLAPQEIATVCGPLLKELPLALVAPAFVKKHNNSVVLREVEELVEYLLVHAGVKMFHKERARGVFNPEIYREMQGLAAGVAASNVSGCSVDKFVALSYSFDLITAVAFSGHFKSQLVAEAARRRMSKMTMQLLTSGDENIVGALPACDFIGVRDSFVKTPGTAFFARAYQFQMADILQNLLSAAVIVPSSNDKGGWAHPIVTIFAPGFVGSFAGLNAKGVAMGVDTIRSPNANQSHVGINSLLMIRSVLHETSDLTESVEFVTRSQRGAPFLYPICDASGDCAVLESGASLPAREPEDPLQYVGKHLTKKDLVPNAAFLAAHSTDTFDRGLYKRFMNYSYDSAFLEFNKALFEYHKFPFNPAAFTNRTVFLFQNWTEDNEAAKLIGNDFFMPPLEEEVDMILGTNYAIIPQMRLTMMNKVDDYFAKITAEAPIWRYEKLLSLIMEKKGQIDFDTMVWLITFLGPDREPGYWHNYAIPGNIESAIIEGSISVYDLKNLRVWFKSGYWADSGTTLTLGNFIEQKE